MPGDEGLPVARGVPGRPALKYACSFTPRGARRFSYEWSPASATLTLRPTIPPSALQPSRSRTRAVLRSAHDGREPWSRADQRLASGGAVRGRAHCRSRLRANVLPGVRSSLATSHVLGTISTSTVPLGFADYLALDAGGGLSLYSVNLARSPRSCSASCATHRPAAVPDSCSASSTSFRRGSRSARNGRAVVRVQNRPERSAIDPRLSDRQPHRRLPSVRTSSVLA